MKRTFLFTVALATLTLSAVSQDVAIIGRSYADCECRRWQGSGMPGRIACAWYDGATCAQLLRTLPEDLAGVERVFGRAPDVVIAWVGTNDVIHSVPVASFQQCAATYQRTIESTFPAAKLAYANVPPMGYLEPYGPGVAALIEEYNAGLRSPVLDVWSATALANG